MFTKTETRQERNFCKVLALCMLSFVFLAALITLTPSAYAESVNGEASTEVYLQTSGSSDTDDGDDADSDDSDTTTTITKDSADSSSPKAGDETTALVFFLVISALSATALVVVKKRTNTKHIGGGNL